ncbi:MAG: transglutaminase [Gammaproteobacteria bacterium]|nr:MAG: transglutaminase [Gammaproteobacteria bacterium]
MRDLRLYPKLERKGVIELILLTQVLVLWPLFNYLPLWIAIVCLSVIAARYVMVRQGWKVPGRLISGVLGVAGGAAIYLSFGTLVGRDAGVSLIALMFCLKLLEMRWYRDAAIVLYLSFFIMVANFLFSQSLLMAVYMVLCILVVVMALQALNRTNGGVEIKLLARQACLMFVQALPLMLILFLFFPRLSEPLWRMPSSLTGTTGISDSMTPGDIGSLVTFTEPAFRVEFDGDVPPSSELYWRGLVFSSFDGLTWSRSRPSLKTEDDVQHSGKRYDYQILLEPHRRNWLYALEMPVPDTMDEYANTTSENTWQRRFVLRSRLNYQLTSYSSSSFGKQLSEQDRQLNITLPGDGNPRARLWAQRAYLDAGASTEAYIQSILKRINTSNYSYTLNPGVMEADTVDDFWFNKQRGFCEHYAGTFVFMMRAAGVPARVVIGYQGGEMNPYANYMIVRQSNAHAWTEVWIEDRGWVRIDPTAAIHPSRVEVDLSQAWMQRDAIFDDVLPGAWSDYSPGVLDKLQLMWDSMNNNWQSMIIDFDAENQHDFFSKLGFPNMTIRDLANGLLAFALLVMAVTTGLFLRRRTKLDKVAVSYNKLSRKLGRVGFDRSATEGPVDYIQRVIDNRPELEDKLKPILQLYINLRFRESKQGDLQQKQFSKRINEFTLKQK